MNSEGELVLADPKAPPSMREFDYFNDAAVPLLDDDVEQIERLTLEDQLARYRRRTKRYSRTIMLMTATLAVCGWFLYGYRDEMAYAFSPARAPRLLGNVTEMQPADIPHNAYVQLEGITEHRGLTQKRMRGLGISREEFWYFRLLGSGGVFVEAPADKEHYGFATRIEVKGRAVDPARDHSYDEVLDHYHRRFFCVRRPVLRVIQIGNLPGEGRAPFIAAFVFLALLFCSNVFVLVRLLRARRRHVYLRR